MSSRSISKARQIKLRALFRKLKAIEFVYLFGSRATATSGPSSDYDLAVFVDPRQRKSSFDLLLTLMGQVPLILKTDKVDVVILNQLDNILLKHNIIRDGQVIYDNSDNRSAVELAIIGEYRDFRLLERKYYRD